MNTLRTLILIGLPIALFGCGGEPGTYSKVREVNDRLRQVADANEIQAWLKHEIALQSQSVSNLPATVDIQEFPGWAEDLNVLAKPHTTVFLDTNARNDYIAMLWAQGGKKLGVLIGTADFKLPPDKQNCFVLRAYPGVYVWCPK